MLIPAKNSIANYYSKMQIETASKRKAVCMLHERGIHFLLLAKSDPNKKASYCAKAQNIISQLQTALIISDQTSQGIFYLYDYCYMAIDRHDTDGLENALQIIGTLTSAFRKLLRRP